MAKAATAKLDDFQWSEHLFILAAILRKNSASLRHYCLRWQIQGRAKATSNMSENPTDAIKIVRAGRLVASRACPLAAKPQSILENSNNVIVIAISAKVGGWTTRIPAIETTAPTSSEN